MNKSRNPRPEAFTLLELLVVMVIMVIFTTVAVPGFLGIVRSFNLADAGRKVVDEINYARQAAVSGNQNIQVRFYPSLIAGNTANYDTIVIVNANLPSPQKWIEKPDNLPTGISISGGGAFSPLLSSTTATVSGSADSTAPYALRTRSYVGFNFRADGSTDLNNTGTLPYLTLYPIHGPAGTNGAPSSDFITILLDPSVGHVRLYRPH